MEVCVYHPLNNYTGASFETTLAVADKDEGICAGKHSVAEFLIHEYNFQLVRLASKSYSWVSDEKDDSLCLQGSEIVHKDEAQSSGLAFDTVDTLLTFVTKRWRERWVTTDIWDISVLDRFLQRPFFLLVTVDAPVSLRWKRFSERLGHVFLFFFPSFLLQL